jgi:hypothetical protein
MTHFSFSGLKARCGQTTPPRTTRPNPHRARCTVRASPTAISCLGAFPTPALTARGTINHWAGIRNPPASIDRAKRL